MAGDRPPNPREAVCRHRPRRPPICAAGKYRLDCSSAEWRRQLVDRTATLPAETESRQPLRACLLAGREQRGFIRPATAQVRKRGRGSGRVSACQYDAVLRAPAQPDRGPVPAKGILRACFQNHPRTVARVAAEPESHQLDRKNSRARTGNEPDNDHTNTPTATQIGRLFLLSFEVTAMDKDNQRWKLRDDASSHRVVALLGCIADIMDAFDTLRNGTAPRHASRRPAHG